MNESRSKAYLAFAWRFLLRNLVPIIFLTLCAVGLIYSRLPFVFFINDLISRLARNSYIVISLIIPVLAGMGLNFGIVLGAMAGQIGAIITVFYKISGIWGFVAAAAIALPFAILFGYLTGGLFNRTKGKEMITGLILSFFANGIYLLLCLVMVGPIIPVSEANAHLLLPEGVGLVNTVDLSLWQYSIDKFFDKPFQQWFGAPPRIDVAKVPIVSIAIAIALYYVVKYVCWSRPRRAASSGAFQRPATAFGLPLATARVVAPLVACALVVGLVAYELGVGVIYEHSVKGRVHIPILSFLLTAILCLGIWRLFKTKLGQDIRAVGQNRHIAEVAGINVDQVRILAVIFSTVLAAWGQLFFLQNLGNLQTYGSHVQVGTFAVAALLVGGASVSRATIGQALVGILLFHALFIVSPIAGKNLLGSAQIGEFFRVFVAYGIIGLALALHAWQRKR